MSTPPQQQQPGKKPGVIEALFSNLAVGGIVLGGGALTIVAFIVVGGFALLIAWWLFSSFPRLTIGLIVACAVVGYAVNAWTKEDEPAPAEPAKRTRQAGVHGDAGFATLEEAQAPQYQLFPPAGNTRGVWLGRFVNTVTAPDELPYPMAEHVLRYFGENNILTVAPAGTGKGACAIIPTLLTSGESIFVLDPKGENFFVTAGRRMNMGGNVIALNPFNVLGRELGLPYVPTARFNPLASLRADDPDFVQSINKLAAAMIVAEGKDPHWTNRARDLVACLMAHVCTNADELEAFGNTLPRVRQILGLPRDEFTLFMMKAAASPVPLVTNNAGSFCDPNSKEVDGIISTALGQLSFLNEPRIIDFLSGGDFDFAELRRAPTTIYCMIPPNELDTYYRFVRLLVQSLFNALSVPPQHDDRSVLVVLDEQAKLRHMEVIETAAALLRGYRVRIWSVFQDLNQLKSIYGDAWETFVSNAGIVQVFTPNDHFTADYFSRRIGQHTVAVTSFNSSTTSGSSGPAAGYGPGGSVNNSFTTGQSVSHQGIPFLTVQNLYGMAPWCSLVFPRGLQYPVVAEKSPYFKERDFVDSKAFLENPYANPELLRFDPYRHARDFASEYRRLLEATQERIIDRRRLKIAQAAAPALPSTT